MGRLERVHDHREDRGAWTNSHARTILRITRRTRRKGAGASGAGGSARVSRSRRGKTTAPRQSIDAGAGFADSDALHESFGLRGKPEFSGESGPAPRVRGAALFQISRHAVHRSSRSESPAPLAR
jgi:hypothetical protein